MLAALSLPDASTCTLSYESWGDETSPRILFCAHGLTRNAMDFEKLAIAATNKRFRVIAPDMPGRGKSPNLANPVFYNNAVNANLCLQLLASLGITPVIKPPPLLGRISKVIKKLLPHPHLPVTPLPPHMAGKELYWVGTSMGGIMAMLVANQAPALIRKLVLNDVGCLITGASLKRIGGYVGHNPSFPSFAEAEQLLHERTTAFSIPQSEWPRFAAHSITQDASGFRIAYDPAIAHAFALPEPIADISLWPLWKAVTRIPTLLIRGEHSDLLTEDTAARMAATHPHLTRYNVASAGHAPALMTEAEIEAVLGFLTT